MKTAVIGSGAWGTALALLLCRNGHDTTLWFRTEEKAAQIRSSRINPRLQSARLPEALKISADPACVRGCDIVVIACPSFPIRSVCRTVAPHLDAGTVLVSVTKGIEEGTLLRMSQIVAQETGHTNVVALSGPCHAEEVAVSIPTGCLAACEDRAMAEFVQDAFMSDTFRVYTRKVSDMKASWTNSAMALSSQAARHPVGMETATSSAWQGPERATTLVCPVSWATI